MYQKHWEKTHKAVCSIHFYGKTNSKVLGLTGFRVEDLMVTSDEVYAISGYNEVKISFYENDGVRIFREFSFSKKEFESLLPPKSHFENIGIVFFSLDNNLLEGTSALEICHNCYSPIGKDAFTISYQPEQHNIGLNSAIISSNYINARGLNFLQFDGTVRSGAGGSPLIDNKSGKILGIVTNKEHKIFHTYRELLKTVDKNLKVLEKVKDKWFIEEVDPVQVLIVNQNQIKHLSKEIFSNFSVASGYALDVSHLKEQRENISEYFG
ncbi:MAG: hypothetical protein ACOCWA_02375 [Bacteroidota bacterium]